MRLTRCVRTLLSVSVVVAMAVLGAGGAARAAAPATGYHRIDLGTLGGGSSEAAKINARGDVIGHSTVADGTHHSFLWRHGRMTDLGAIWATDLNDAGQVVGYLQDSDLVSHAFLWDRGRLISLGTLGTSSTAIAINNRGEVIGYTDAAGSRPYLPFLWSHGRMRALPLESVAGINDRGEIAGGMPVGYGYHACVWRAGTVTDLGALGSDRSNTTGINDRGWVVGWSMQPVPMLHGLVWRGGTTTDVGSLGGGETYLSAVNNRGQAIGWSLLPDITQHLVLWQGGRLTDLTTAGLTDTDGVVDINDSGVLTGAAWFGSSLHAAIYRPGR